MKNIFTLGFILLISTQMLWAQSKEFEETFLRETASKENTENAEIFNNVKNLSFFPDTLPSWFFEPPLPSNSSIYAIGISDPDLSIEEAIQQAKHRAMVLAILYNKTLIQYFRDIYSTEYSHGNQILQGQRFDTYFKLSATSMADSSLFNIQHQHITRYNEAIVLINYTPRSSETASQEQISAFATAFYIEAQMDKFFEPQGEYEFVSNITKETPHKSQMAKYVFREKGNRYLSISEFQGQTLHFPLYPYRYANPQWEPNTTPLTNYYGLWSQFIKDFLIALAFETEQSSIRIKTLDQQHQTETRNLAREVAIKNIKLLINGIEFGNDNIVFELNTFEL